MRVQRSIMAALLTLLVTGAAGAAEHRYMGNVELRAPVWSDVAASAGTHWDNLELAGDLRVSRVLGPIGLRVSGEHTFHQAGLFRPENQLKAGLELPLPHAWTAIAYWDRRFDAEVNRVFVGLRWGFGGQF